MLNYQRVSGLKLQNGRAEFRLSFDDGATGLPSQSCCVIGWLYHLEQWKCLRSTSQKVTKCLGKSLLRPHRATSAWKSWFIRDILPKWPQFRLVNSYDLSRCVTAIWIHVWSYLLGFEKPENMGGSFFWLLHHREQSIRTYRNWIGFEGMAWILP